MPRAGTLRNSVVAGLLFLICMAGEARAQSILIVVYDSSGENTALLQKTAEEALVAPFDIRNASVDPEVMAQAVECVPRGKPDKACLKNILDVTAIKQFLVLSTSRSTDDGKLVLGVTATLLEGKTSRTETSECRTCESPEALGDMAHNLVLRITGAKGQWKKNAHLVINTNPADALVSFGGTRGSASKTWDLPDGSYTVEITKKGYRSVTQAVKLAPGATETLDVTLEYIPLTTGQRLRRFKWVFLTGGVVLTGLGVVGIAIDGRDRFEQGDNGKPTLLDTEWATLPHGIAGVSLGAVLIATGVYLIATDSPGTEANAGTEKAVTLQFVGDGLGIGVSGRF